METGEPPTGAVGKDLSFCSSLREITSYAPAEGLVVKNHLLAAFIRAVCYFYMATAFIVSVTAIVCFLKDLELPAALMLIACVVPCFVSSWVFAPALKTLAIEKYAMGPPDSSISSIIPSEKMSTLVI